MLISVHLFVNLTCIIITDQKFLNSALCPSNNFDITLFFKLIKQKNQIRRLSLTKQNSFCYKEYFKTCDSLP